MISNNSIAHDDTSLQSDTCTDLYTGTNDDIWAKNGGGVDFCGLRCPSAKSLGKIIFKAYWVDQDVTPVHPFVLRGVGEQRGVSSGQMRQVKAGTYISALESHRGPRERRTENEVFWLSDIHPESSKIVRVQLSVCSNFREDLLLDRGWSKLAISV